MNNKVVAFSPYACVVWILSFYFLAYTFGYTPASDPKTLTGYELHHLVSVGLLAATIVSLIFFVRQLFIKKTITKEFVVFFIGLTALVLFFAYSNVFNWYAD
ncbi:hypothetical protein SAMN05421780_1114 [Flexibacter flexilis DSM 6793]|uniref:Uncharacterized protein n=1 Tax=Flexibacter flexilis DSM 6793 TaxID=927664 RepID=A0A1I1MYK4_9BACT|nr:hypothetical protein [Flexibacter flexilis]SFC86640.1 hypothetical protein SAMN05421780_1114 [Flexibacter flexilis DSM 6793]